MSKDHPDVKRELDRFLQNPAMYGWIKRVMPELLELHPIVAQGEVYYLLDIIEWRASQYFGPNAPYGYHVDKLG